MKWYTVLASDPDSSVIKRLTSNVNFKLNKANEWVLWDGEGNKKDILNLCDALFPYFKTFRAFSGKNKGKCFFEVKPFKGEGDLI